MSKRQPEDWGLEDVQFAICGPHGPTLAQVQALDFPPADYTEEGGPFWHDETVVHWLGYFHAAILTLEKSGFPENFEQFLATLRGIAQE